MSLNLAGLLARAFLASKITGVLVAGVFLLGLVAVAVTPREENPQILVPAAIVTIPLPGATALEVDELVVTPMQAVLGEISGVDHTFGRAETGLATIQVQFNVGEAKEAALIRLHHRVAANLDRLPADAGAPVIRAVDADDVPIVTVTLASSRYDDYALKRMADRIAERLHGLEDVSVVAVYGGRDRQITMELDPRRLEAFDVSIGDVMAAFEHGDLAVTLPGPVVDGGIGTVRLDGFLKSADGVRSLVLGVRNGRMITVGDIAEVTDGPPVEVERSSRFAFGGGDPRSADIVGEMPAVTIAVAKKAGANAVVVADGVIERVERMRGMMVPDGVHVVTTRDDGRKADDAVDTLIEHLCVAVATVGLVLVVFLGWRAAAIVMLTVPMVLFITLVADMLGGETINRVTLFALILSLGLLVDDAIVVIENIHRHHTRGDGSGDKAAVTIAATNEIGNATTLATVAIMLGFGSLFLISGMVGEYFHPVAYNAPIAMAASLLVAYSVAPWAANRWLASTISAREGGTHEPADSDPLRRAYLRLIWPLLTRAWARRLLAFLVVALLSGSILQVAWQFVRPEGVAGPLAPFGVGLGFVLKDDKNTFSIILDMPATAAIEETDRVIRDLGRRLVGDPNVVSYQSWVGQAGVPDFNAVLQGTADRAGASVGEIRVNLTDKHKRSESSIDIVRGLRPEFLAIIAPVDGARIRLVEDPPGPPVRATVLAELYGPDPGGLRALSERVAGAFDRTYDMVDRWDGEPEDVPEYRLVPDREKAALMNVSVAAIAQTLGVVYGGVTLARVHPPDERNPVDVRAFVPRRHAIAPSDLEGLMIRDARGRPVPLGELVEITRTTADRPIHRKDDERVTYVGGELERSVSLNAVLDLDRRLDGLTGPDGRPLRTGNLTFNARTPDVIDGYTLLWDGEMRMVLDTYRDMGVALAVALTLVYLLLVGYYRSYLTPLIAMAPVPLGLIGVFPGHWVMGADFSATSMVGVIALSAVVTRSSLLIIDFILDEMRRGVALDQAVASAGAVRLRPIVLTTLAIVLGSGVMLVDPVFGGLAISLMFGTVASTVLTIFVVPVLVHRAMSRIERRTPMMGGAD